MRFVVCAFRPGTGVTRGNILVNELSHVWPVEVSLHKLQCLGLSKVSCRRRVMEGLEDLNLERIIVGDIDEVFVQQEVILDGQVFIFAVSC